jgi:hypothetical protein
MIDNQTAQAVFHKLKTSTLELILSDLLDCHQEATDSGNGPWRYELENGIDVIRESLESKVTHD